MLKLNDKNNVINRNIFHNVTEETIYGNILKNDIGLFDMEQILTLKKEPDLLLIGRLIKHQIKELKNELTFIISKNRDFNIENLTNKISIMIQQVKLIGLLNNKNLENQNNKIYGDFIELTIFVKNLKHIIIDNDIILYFFFKHFDIKKKETIKFIKLLSNLDQYYSFYANLLKSFGEYIVTENMVHFDYDMNHLELYNLYQSFLIVKEYKKLFQSNDFLKQIKIKLLDLITKFISVHNINNIKFIISNPDMCRDILMMSHDINYKQDLLVNIFTLLNHNDFLINNLTEIFDFVFKINCHLENNKQDSGNKIFLKKILIANISSDNYKLDLLVDYIISNNVNKKFISLFSLNDLVNNYIHEHIKKKLAVLIINNNISIQDLENLQELFNINVFKKLHHDLVAIISDFKFSSTFTTTVSNNLQLKTNVFALNSNYWGFNFSDGYIDTSDKKTSSKFTEKLINENNFLNKTCDFINIWETICLGYADTTDNKRKFKMIGHLGNVNFDYELNNITKNINMLPIQSYIFQKIYNDEKITKNDIIRDNYINSYGSIFINEIINSLLIGGIVVNKNNKLIINCDIANINSDYIEILYTNNITVHSDYIPVYSKNTIISCWINKFIKIKKEPLDELYNKVFTKLNCGVISITRNDFDKTITHMINNDYIGINEEIVYKILY